MHGRATSGPSISVIIPAYNEEQFLGQAIESIARQSFADLEIIIADNGSTDGTAKIIEQWAKRDLRVKALRLEKPCLHKSLRRAVAVSSGEFIARIDADDVAVPDRLERQYQAMAANPALGLLGSAADYVNRAGRKIGSTRPLVNNSDLQAYLPTGCPFVHSSVMMRRDAYVRAGGYRAGLNQSEDYDLWLRLASVTELANLPERLVQYRLRNDSFSTRRAVRQAISSISVRAARVARDAGLPEPLINGVPSLRRALPLLQLPRRDVAVRIHRDLFERWFLAFPVPFGIKRGLRTAAVTCGLKPLFALYLNCVAAVRSVRNKPGRWGP